MTVLALDTSVAVPLLVQGHRAHARTVSWRRGRDVCLAGHAVAETYSVLTRLPDDLRADPADAARVMAHNLGRPLTLAAGTHRRLPSILADVGVSGGAVFDALVALAAVEHDATLATMDARARETYERVGARVILLRAA